jgi:hypothetical protein
MAQFAFIAPVLPGKDARALPEMLRGRMEEYEESRRRQGVTMERVYLMETPMGPAVIAYIESRLSLAETMQASVASDLAIDRDFNAMIEELHGIDVSQPPPVDGEPEVIAEWVDPEVHERRNGLAFMAPIIPGRTDAARRFGQEAFVNRRDEHTASRRALDLNIERVILTPTPMGDMLVVYLEGADPAQANRDFAASQSAYDAWFKDQLREIFPPEVDFSQPMPPVEEIWNYHRAAVSA